MAKSVAELKRNANTGRMCLELVEYYGKTGSAIPPNQMGVRRVIGSNSRALKILTANGGESELTIESAKLIEYTGTTLTVYNIGVREPTREERFVIDKWKKRAKVLGNCNLYYAKKSFFSKTKYPYMSGELINGKQYIYRLGKVLDKAVRGDVILRYNVYMT